MAKISININKGTVEQAGPKPEQKPLIVGIDLGTTNSLVAYMLDAQPVCVNDPNGKNTLVPSVIHFQPDQSVLVGDAAKAKLVSDPANTIYSVKRLMGKSFKDLARVSDYFGYKIIDEDQDKLVKIRVQDKFFTPVELSSFILAELKLRIEARLGRSVEKAVITVPAYFNDAQRQATRDAGKLAGLDVLRIVNEPTAASLAYGIGLDLDETKTVAVYDLGGGTFDISILRIEQGIFEVLATNGDTFLGGDDFDQAIIEHWVKTLGIDPESLAKDKSLMQGLRLEAEQAKKTLSSQDTFSSDKLSSLPQLTLSRETFEQLIQGFVQKTLDCSKAALRDAQVQTTDIDEIIMVGGSTRTPLVKNSVQAFFGKAVNDSLNPDEVVALGAAVQADILAGNNKNFLLLDITPLSLGIETVGGLMDVIIARNSKVPTAVGRNYTTSVDGQTKLKVAVFQGERDLVKDNRKLGEFILNGIPPMPAGIPKIEIQFILDADGILKVKASELRSNTVQTVEMRAQYGLSEEDMAKMLLDSIAHAQDDMKTRALIEAQTEAKTIILAAHKFIQQNSAIMSEEEIAETQQLTSLLEQATTDTDKDAIQVAMDNLNAFTAPIAHRALDVNIADAMKGKVVLED